MLLVIAILLFLILLVMLLGSGPVLGLIGFAAAAAIAIFVIVLVFRIAAEFVTSFANGVRNARGSGHAWLWKFPLAVGFVWTLSVYLIAYFEAGTINGKALQRSLDGIAYWWVGPLLVVAAFGLRIVESAPTWIPQIPDASWRFMMGVGEMLSAPVLLPTRCWKKIRNETLAGRPVNPIWASVRLLGSVVGGLYSFVIGAGIAFAVLSVPFFLALQLIKK